MQLKFLYPFWGNESLRFDAFLNLVKTNGFNGIEINIPKNSIFETEFYDGLHKERSHNPNFICGLQQVFEVANETPQEYLDIVLGRLQDMMKYQPDFINSHTGKDHYSCDDNCKIIEAIENFSITSGVPVYHEIHRGRFTFHSQSTLPYLNVFPDIKFVGDFSHWFVVSESLLEDQEEVIQQIIPNITHLHARVSTEQASQVNNPFAPEWSNHLKRFTNIWKQTVAYHKDHTDKYTITPEFGPFPYMPQAPFTQEPLANQHEINVKMKDFLKTQLT